MWMELAHCVILCSAFLTIYKIIDENAPQKNTTAEKCPLPIIGDEQFNGFYRGQHTVEGPICPMEYTTELSK